MAKKTAPNQVPAVGRIVHYVMPAGPRRGEHRAAIVSAVGVDDRVSLHVCLLGVADTGNPARHPALELVAFVEHDEQRSPGTWHWPERQ